VQTGRLHESFEGSHSSLASSGGGYCGLWLAASGRLMHFLIFLNLGVKRFLGHNFGSRHARRSSKALATLEII